MDIQRLNELSVRRGDGGAQFFRGMRARGELSQLAGKRLVILVHGFAVTAADATSTYQSFIDELIKVDHQLAATSFCSYWGFHWPGDHSGPPGVRGAAAKGTFSVRIGIAGDAGWQLADLLSRLHADQEVYFVAHSLGCRVVMETLFEISRWRGPWLGASVKGAFLLAAAVPWLFCTKTPPAGDPFGREHFFEKRPREPEEWVFYSAKDWALNKPFKAGEWLHGEGGGDAVGRSGFPLRRWDHPVETTLGHSDYWPNKDIIKQMPEMLGLQTRRSPANRPIGNEQPAWKRLPHLTGPHRSVGTAIEGEWHVLIRENGSRTRTLRQLLLNGRGTRP
jgi:pimeloyl-ACP methyl ester carboxylesterase